jgi:transposase
MSQAKRERQLEPWTGLRVVNPHAAGLDLGSSEIWAAVPPDSTREPVRVFGTLTPDLALLADWLAACGVDTLAMEATGVYWIPVFEYLVDRGFQAYVVNAQHIRNVPGRKSDRQDCQWLQELHSVGLLRGSFRPEAEIVALRAYLRQRSGLIEDRVAHIQHMQKALLQMNLQLPQAVKDITGVTGLAIIRAIVAGERDPQRLAALRQSGVKKSSAEIAKALTGHYRPEHLFALKQALALYDFYSQQIRECDAEIERAFTNLKPTVPPDDLPPLGPSDKPDSKSKNGPTYDARSLLYRWVGVDLVAIHGLNAATVQTILAEIGPDLQAFPTEKQFCAWLGLAPRNDISGGKVLHSRTLKTHNRAGQAFRLAAQSVSRSSDSVFGAFYRRMRSRVGPKQAIVATAHKLARCFYHMLKTRTPFHDLGGAEYERQARERDLRNLTKRAAKLGLALVPSPTLALEPAPTVS